MISIAQDAEERDSVVECVWQRGKAQACPGDTAVERGNSGFSTLRTVRHTTAVSRFSACHRTPRRWREASPVPSHCGDTAAGGSFLDPAVTDVADIERLFPP